MISDLHVEKAVAGGLGLAREPEGRVVLVRGGLPGDAGGCLRRGGVVWRGTFYPVSALRAGRRVAM